MKTVINTNRSGKEGRDPFIIPFNQHAPVKGDKVVLFNAQGNILDVRRLHDIEPKLPVYAAFCTVGPASAQTIFYVMLVMQVTAVSMPTESSDGGSQITVQGLCCCSPGRDVIPLSQPRKHWDGETLVQPTMQYRSGWSDLDYWANLPDRSGFYPANAEKGASLSETWNFSFGAEDRDVAALGTATITHSDGTSNTVVVWKSAGGQVNFPDSRLITRDTKLVLTDLLSNRAIVKQWGGSKILCEMETRFGFPMAWDKTKSETWIYWFVWGIKDLRLWPSVVRSGGVYPGHSAFGLASLVCPIALSL